MILEIFDLDGTLTAEFSAEIGDKTNSGLTTYSSWNLITRELACDKEEFDRKATTWKKMVTTTPNIDKVLSSKEMTEIGIREFPAKNRNSEAILAKAFAITQVLVKHGIVVFPAIKYIEYLLSKDVTCLISTASYLEGAVGFVRGLVANNLLDQKLAKKIIFSGTEIDWRNLQVTHMNVDVNKLAGLEQALNMPLETIRPKIHAVFGDDPEINDRSLLELGKFSFAIKTNKNADSILPPNCVFTNWDEILAHRDRLDVLYASLMRSQKNIQ